MYDCNLFFLLFILHGKRKTQILKTKANHGSLKNKPRFSYILEGNQVL